VNASDVISLLQTSLTTFAAARDNGRVEVAEDPLHALEILAASPGGWGIVLLDKGEQPETRGPVQLLRARFTCYVWAARGLAIRQDEKNLILVRHCEAVRDHVLTRRFEQAGSAEVPQYDGPGRQGVVMPDGFPLNAYELDFFLRVSGTQSLTPEPIPQP
jgi:hypothetical protein